MGCRCTTLYKVSLQRNVLRPDLLKTFPGESKMFPFSEKNKIRSREWINARMHVALPQIAHLWLSVKVVSGCTVLFGSRIINCSQVETFGNLLSRLADRGGQVLRESGWSCDFFFLFFTGHPGLLCDWASSNNKTLSRSGLTIVCKCAMHQAERQHRH